MEPLKWLLIMKGLEDMKQNICDCCARQHKSVEEILVQINVHTFEYVVCENCLNNNLVPYVILD